MNISRYLRMALGAIAGLTALLTASLLSVAGASAASAPGHVSIALERSHGAHASQPAPTSANSRSARVCSAVTAGHASCLALKRDGLRPVPASASPDAIPAGFGYGPSQLQSAYNLTSASASAGSGRTIAIVDAYDNPTAASDLAAYRAAAGLPPVPSFRKLNQNGQTSPLPATPPAGDDWRAEESLDVDMASAICPLCNIVLVEANDDTSNGLFVAENTAASVAGYVSNSWGEPEFSSEPTYDAEYFNHPGVAITASAGDSGYGVAYPAASGDVISVGGTSLSPASNSRGWSESVWGGTGSGCSAVERQPPWQAGLTGCSHRIDNDVAADANPSTGVAVYDSADGGWIEFGGTSASAPMIAAMYALGGNPGSTPAVNLYTHASFFFDVTSGGNGSCSPAYLCTAGTGYDGPTGIGSPDGLAGLVGVADTINVTSPGNQSGAVGTPVSLHISATDSLAGQTLTYSAAGLPAGLTISSSSGLISGTPATAGTSTVTVTATDPTGVRGVATFTWTIGPCATFSWQATKTFTAGMAFTNCKGTLIMQTDGNFVLYNENGAPIWATGTNGNTGDDTVFQADGNLVVYTASGVPIWATGTWGTAAGGTFDYQSDGNLVIYTSAGQPVWASNTVHS